MALNIIKNYLTKNRCYQRAVKRNATGIQLHTIGCAQGTAKSVADYWNQAAVSACVHYIVDCDTQGKVLQCLPEEYYSWADAGYGNGNLITFEICESDYMKYGSGANYTVTDESKFRMDILRGYRTAVELCADICRRYGWKPSAKLPNGLYLISSHDEGRRAGLSSAHVDPTHVWDRLGLTMDRFRKDVEKVMGGAELQQETTEPLYRVRRTWTDVSSQLFAGTLEGAKKACPAGYTVFDTDGKAVYTNKIPEGTKTDNIWMGWTKRETGKDGLRNIHGDSGKAYGLQFDYRYGLVPFLQCCVDYDAEKYAAFKKFISLGTGNSALVYNKELGQLWQRLYDADPAEFGQLQYLCAYNNYYLPAKKYVQQHYGINMDRHAPAVKGTLWSMAFRSGSETGAKKFSRCSDSMSDKDIINRVYPSYGSQDAGRWTKAGQWGDALKALESGEYTTIVLSMDSSAGTGAGKPGGTGTETGGNCRVVQCGSFAKKENAEKLVTQLRAAGFTAIIKSEDGQYKVQAGAFDVLANAQKQVERLKVAGFDAIIK